MSHLRWAAALAATLALLCLELLGASRSGSQALWADALHVGLDALAILGAGLLFLRPFARRQRAVLAAQAGLLVMLGALYALRVLGFLPAHQHFTNPDLALRVAIVGLVANLGAAWMLRGDNGLRGALAHALADAAGSVLAVAGLTMAKATGDASWDALAALAICATMWLLAAILASTLLRRPDPGAAEVREPQRSAAGSLALAAVLVACTLLVAASATAAAATPTWRFLHPSVGVDHGDLEGNGPWEQAMQAPAGSLSARLLLELRGAPRLLAEEPRFDVSIWHAGTLLAQSTWDPANPLELATDRWSTVPVEVEGDHAMVNASVPDLPARDLVVEVKPLQGSIAPGVDEGWRLEWRLFVETVEPFKVEPRQPVACPPPPKLLAQPC